MRQLEGEPDSEHREELERVIGLGLDEDVEVLAVVALEEVDRRRQHDEVGERDAHQEQQRRGHHHGDRDLALVRVQGRDHERVRLVEQHG